MKIFKIQEIKNSIIFSIARNEIRKFGFQKLKSSVIPEIRKPKILKFLHLKILK